MRLILWNIWNIEASFNRESVIKHRNETNAQKQQLNAILNNFIQSISIEQQMFLVSSRYRDAASITRNEIVQA